MITFQSVPHTSATPATASHTAPVLDLGRLCARLYTRRQKLTYKNSMGWALNRIPPLFVDFFSSLTMPLVSLSSDPSTPAWWVAEWTLLSSESYSPYRQVGCPTFEPCSFQFNPKTHFQCTPRAREMFSAAGRTTANSPPHKRKRTLKIADVSCLVASKQRAAFRSPEKPTKPPSRPQSPLSKNPTLKQEPVANPDMFSQELIEEDNNIQSSMPQYFDHVFGDGGNSQSISQSYVHVGVKDSPSHAPLAIQESQGFTVVSTSLPADNIIIKSESTTAGNECSPVLFSSPTTPPKLPTNYSSCKLAQNSQTLLPSATLTHSTPSATTTIEKPIPPLVPPKAPSSKKEDSTNDKVVKKPSRKRKLSGNRTKYTCPPSCVSLEECVRLKTDSKVSILAIVLQGIYSNH